MHGSLRFHLPILFFLFTACISGGEEQDAGSDETADASKGRDATSAVDAGTTPKDSGVDGPKDASSDSGAVDARTSPKDSGIDGKDASSDSGADASPPQDGGNSADASGPDAGGGDGVTANPTSLSFPEPGGAAQSATILGGKPPYQVSGCTGIAEGEVSGTMLLVSPKGVGTCSLVISDSSAPAQQATLAVAIPEKATVLAPTPPMGWNSWNKFGCNVSESLIKGVADAMVSSGMKAAGYKYVNIDDCWQVSRDGSGAIVADSGRFPGGMTALASYIHNLGLKFGVYSDRGTSTCAGRPGSQAHESQDAKTYASWGVDYLKYDNCNANLDQRTQYQTMRDALRSSGREIVFSICAWGFASWMPETGQLWRTTGDINDSWKSVTGILDTNAGLANYASPGHWNDPDMLEVGNGGMSSTEYRSHFSLWAIMAAPLIAGNDIRSMSNDTKAILTAKEVIQVNQDPLGHQGKRVRKEGDLEVWSKVQSGVNRRAVALFNRGSGASNITVNWSEIGLGAGAAVVRDLWARSDLGSFTGKYTASVPSHGVALLEIVEK